MERFRMGELTARQADQLNQLAATVEKLKLITVAAPLAISRNAGIPVISMPFSQDVLAQVTVVSADTPAVYTCRRLTRGFQSPDENEVIPYTPEFLYSQVLCPADSLTGISPTLAVDDVVMITEIPDYKGWYWAELVAESCAGCSGSASGCAGPGEDVFPALASDPTYTSSDPYAVTDTACIDGILFVLRARQRVVWDASICRPVIDQYDYELSEEGCCDCGSGSASATGSSVCVEYPVVCVTYSGGTGPCACLNGLQASLTMFTSDPDIGFVEWRGRIGDTDLGTPVILTCHGGAWEISHYQPVEPSTCEIAGGSGTAPTQADLPVEIPVTGMSVNGSLCGTITATVEAGFCDSGTGTGSAEGCCENEPDDIFMCITLLDSCDDTPPTETPMERAGAGLWDTGGVNLCVDFSRVYLQCLAGGVWRAWDGHSYLQGWEFVSATCDPLRVEFTAEIQCSITACPISVVFSEAACSGSATGGGGGCNGGTEVASPFGSCAAALAAPQTLGVQYDYDSSVHTGTVYWAWAVSPSTTYHLDTACLTGFVDVGIYAGPDCAGQAFVQAQGTGTPGTTPLCGSFTTGGSDTFVTVRTTPFPTSGCVSVKLTAGAC